MQVWHQTGAGAEQTTRERYASLGFKEPTAVRVMTFIDDMAAAYAWAELVICRAGASTVSELAVVKLPAILVPYPHHRDRQQWHNAHWLCAAGAAWLQEPSQLTATTLRRQLQRLVTERSTLQYMSQQAAALAVLDADQRIANCCLEVANG